MPDWRALLRPKRKRSRTSHSPKATPQPVQSAQTPKSESASAASPPAIGVNQRQSSPKRPTSATSKTTDKISSSVANGLKLALHLLKEAVTGIGVPGLEAAVSGVVKVIDIIDAVRDNDRDLESLSRRISGVATAVSKSPSLHPKDEVPEGLRLRMETFLKELQVLLDEVEDILSDRNIALRTANSEANRDAITEINAGIDQLISHFTAEGIVSLELNVAGTRQEVRGVGSRVDGVHHKVDDVQKMVGDMDQRLYGVDKRFQEAQLAQEYEALIEKIPRVHARYNDTSTKPSRACHDGTRTELLQGINMWIKGGADDTPYLWLCGEVGVGKTTVAHTIAKGQESLKQLGASFFFSRHDSGRQDPHRLFPSLAYQLARFDPGIWRALAEILKPDPDIVNRGLQEQFTKLVLEPLSRSGMASSRTVVIVIDGLDECSDPASVLDALALGVEYVNVRLRVLVCSRPYAAIQSKFKFTPLYHLASQTHFHDINSETLSNDVSAFLTWSLREMASRPANCDLPTPWPTEDQLTELVSRASGLFIIASTYAKYIDDPVEGNPAAQLRRILSRKRVIGSSPLAELDALYDQVLDDLKRSLKTVDELAIARDIIETVILAKSEMNMHALSGLLCMESSDVRSVLRRLTAVILLPEDEDKAITPFHASFGEYIQDDTRCTVRELSVSLTLAHGRIAARCITAITSADENSIIGVEYREYDMPHHLKYASQYLASHFSLSSLEDAAGDGMKPSRSSIWTWLNLMFALGLSLGDIEESVTVTNAGFTSLLGVEELDAATKSGVSIGRLMAANHASAINRTPEIPPRFPALTTESADVRRSKGIQIMKFNHREDDDISTRLKSVLGILADVRRWNLYNFPNMSVKSVVFDLDSLSEVVLLVSTSTTFRGLCSLSKYLERMDHLDALSRVRLASEVARTLRRVHEASPSRSHSLVAPDIMLVSAEGKHVPPPGLYSVAELSEPGDSSDDASSDCQMTRSSARGFEDLWYFPEETDPHWPQRAQSTDIWHFGSILFQIMTNHLPLVRYKQLAKGKAALGYDEDVGDVPNSYWNRSVEVEDHKRRARFETAVSLLLDTMEGCEEVKPVLKACWAFEPQDRPPMRVVVEQLEAIIRAAGEVP